MQDITLEYIKPKESLRDCLSVFYELTVQSPMFTDVERADLAQIRFVMNEQPGEYIFFDGLRMLAPHVQIVGPSTVSRSFKAPGPARVVGVGVMPTGWAQLIGLDASLLVNRVIDATAVFGTGILRDRVLMQRAETMEERIAILEALIERLLGNVRPAKVEFARTVDQWLSASASPAVEDLVRACGVSRRQVERQCKRFYGAPPKLLARKYRALKAAIALSKGEVNVGDITEHFYDQSHFIREMKHFTGETPGKLSEGDSVLAQLMLKRTELAGLDPIITDA